MDDLISRADAIEAVRNVARDLIQDRCMPLGCATDFTDALSALPSANVIEFDFNKYQPRVRNKVHDALSSADAVHGEWKHTITWQPYCSNCEYVFGEDEEFSPFWKYCPMCGARMTPYKGGDDE